MKDSQVVIRRLTDALAPIIGEPVVRDTHSSLPEPAAWTPRRMRAMMAKLVAEMLADGLDTAAVAVGARATEQYISKVYARLATCACD